MGVRLVPLFEQDINCKDVSYEVVAKAGAKRKRAEAISSISDGNDEGKAAKMDQ